MSIAIRDAKTAYNYLNGVFCIYKAKKMPYRTLYKVLSETLCIGKFKRFVDYYNWLS